MDDPVGCIVLHRMYRSRLDINNHFWYARRIFVPMGQEDSRRLRRYSLYFGGILAIWAAILIVVYKLVTKFFDCAATLPTLKPYFKQEHRCDQAHPKTRLTRRSKSRVSRLCCGASKSVEAISQWLALAP
jgi:hypothetical protein